MVVVGPLVCRPREPIVNYGVANPAVTLSAFHDNCFGGCTVTNCSCTTFFPYWSGTASTNLPSAPPLRLNQRDSRASNVAWDDGRWWWG
jgi:hypothetical protein